LESADCPGLLAPAALSAIKDEQWMPRAGQALSIQRYASLDPIRLPELVEDADGDLGLLAGRHPDHNIT
jgi:hypothetical protein